MGRNGKSTSYAYRHITENCPCITETNPLSYGIFCEVSWPHGSAEQLAGKLEPMRFGGRWPESLVLRGPGYNQGCFHTERCRLRWVCVDLQAGIQATIPWTKHFTNYNCFLVQVPLRESKVGYEKLFTKGLFLYLQKTRLKPMGVISLLQYIFNNYDPIGRTKNYLDIHICVNAH